MKNWKLFKKKKIKRKFSFNLRLYVIFSSLIIIFLVGSNIYNRNVINDFKNELILLKKVKLTNSENIEKEKNSIKIDRVYFNENINLKKYWNTKFNITDEGKWFIENIRNLHKTPTLIAPEFQHKDLCSGYIWKLSQKIWGKSSIYSIWMQNTKKWKLAQAWELPYFYEAFWGEILAELSDFSLKDKDYLEKISLESMKNFFAKAFTEEALFWDIWFLYSKTNYVQFLKKWNYNSHITKNMWLSDFEITFSNVDDKKTNLENFMYNLWCKEEFIKYIDLIENYKMFLNWKNIVLFEKEFYFIDENNILWEKVNFKYLDKITYKDITITHFFETRSHVDSLFKFSCDLNFYPINVMSINSRMIEKM